MVKIGLERPILRFSSGDKEKRRAYPGFHQPVSLRGLQARELPGTLEAIPWQLRRNEAALLSLAFRVPQPN
jgi:hypothetical protein